MNTTTSPTELPATPCSPLPVDFNINDYVMVKLTPRGRDLHRKAHHALMASLPRTPDWAYSPPTEDAEGWSKWQAWDLMSSFGEHISLGGEPPFETGIRIMLPANGQGMP